MKISYIDSGLSANGSKAFAGFFDFVYLLAYIPIIFVKNCVSQVG